MENVQKLFHHGQHTPLYKQSFWAKTTLYIYLSDEMLAKAWERMNNGSFL